ncbi:MAG TPA: DinB family protein [Bryobacteraceae bacterium]|nr:DinB family protein [Bryobacteraceae bacterium]
MVRLETILTSWKAVREDTAGAVEAFPADDLRFQPLPDVMSFVDIARHILESSHALAGMLLDGVENMMVPEFRPMVQKYAEQVRVPEEKQALTNQLRGALEQQLTKLAEQSPEFYTTEITRFDGQRVTRLEMLQFVKEHELTHRAQLFMYLRMKGIVPPTTRRRLAKAKA